MQAADKQNKDIGAQDSRESLHLYQQAGHLFRRAQQIAVSLFYEVAGEELTPIQYAILLMVKEHPGVDQKTLAGLVALDSSTTWQTAMRLEEKGLLMRDLQIDGRRYRRLYLTAESEATLERIAGAIRRLDEEMFKWFSAQERSTFMQLLHRFVHVNNNRSRAPLEARGSVSSLPKKRVKK